MYVGMAAIHLPGEPLVRPAVHCPIKGDCISYTHNEHNGVGFSHNGIEFIDGLYIIITTSILCN